VFNSPILATYTHRFSCHRMDNLHVQAPHQHSIRLVLQCLERLERLGCRAHEEMKEIRSLFADLLGSCQSDIAMENSGGYDSTIDSQTGLDGPQGKFVLCSALPLDTHLYEQAYCPAVPPTLSQLLNFFLLSLSTACTLGPVRHSMARVFRNHR
jgi:hypothetical protein